MVNKWPAVTVIHYSNKLFPVWLPMWALYTQCAVSEILGSIVSTVDG